MMFKPKYPKGATPLSADELGGLIPDYIRTQGELNTLERDNIMEAINWVAKKKKTEEILSVSFAYELHRRMFNQVWKWAGTPRNSDKNIGIPWTQISTALPTLFMDAQTWIHKKTYPWDELGARFHFRLVAIHSFPNGNGRHARLMTDTLLENNGQNPFTWGSNLGELPLEDEGPARTEYIKSLQEADERKFNRLIQFVRT